MPDPAILFAVLIGLAGAVITVLPAAAWLRGRSRRKEALERFLSEACGASETHRRREKNAVDRGFTDIFVGRTPGFAYALTAKIVPFRGAQPYWLSIERLQGDDREVRRWIFEPGSEWYEPIARIHALLLFLHRRKEAREQSPLDRPGLAIVRPPN